MRQWEVVRAELITSLRCPRTVRLYREICERQALFEIHATPAALADHLQRCRDHAVANVLYLAIIEVWRNGAHRHSDVAGQILWLSLWPLLTTTFRRQTFFWAGHERELISELGLCMGAVLRATDLTRVESVALTIYRNTESRLVSARRASLREENLFIGDPVSPAWEPAFPDDDRHPREAAQPEYLQLAPATQPLVRGMADGLAAELVESIRDPRIHLLGNGVVPLAAALAWQILLNRALARGTG